MLSIQLNDATQSVPLAIGAAPLTFSHGSSVITVNLGSLNQSCYLVSNTPVSEFGYSFDLNESLAEAVSGESDLDMLVEPNSPQSRFMSSQTPQPFAFLGNGNLVNYDYVPPANVFAQTSAPLNAGDVYCIKLTAGAGGHAWVQVISPGVPGVTGPTFRFRVNHSLPYYGFDTTSCDLLQQEGALVSSLAGSAGVTGNTNGSVSLIGEGNSPLFNHPAGVGVDSVGNLYVADTLNYLIRVISPLGVVSTLAGTGTKGHLNATGTLASFYRPSGVVADSSGNLYIADSYNNMIREINTSQVVSTLAGSTTHGTTNGAGVTALFYRPTGIAMDASDNLYVADSYNDMIRLIAPGGVVSTLAGSAGVTGSANGPVSQATFYRPTGIAVDANDNIYVVDTYNNLIREISGGVVSTLAGSGKVGHANGTGIAATFNHPSGIALDLLGNIYVADTGNSMIRKITPQGVVSTLAGDLIPGSTNGYGTHSRFYFPSGLVFVAPDLLYVADSNNDMIRLVQLDQ